MTAGYKLDFWEAEDEDVCTAVYEALVTALAAGDFDALFIDWPTGANTADRAIGAALPVFTTNRPSRNDRIAKLLTAGRDAVVEWAQDPKHQVLDPPD